MTTNAQIDQLIISLQGMKASFGQSSKAVDGGDFNFFASALSDAESVVRVTFLLQEQMYKL